MKNEKTINEQNYTCPIITIKINSMGVVAQMFDTFEDEVNAIEIWLGACVAESIYICLRTIEQWGFVCDDHFCFLRSQEQVDTTSKHAPI